MINSKFKSNFFVHVLFIGLIICTMVIASFRFSVLAAETPDFRHVDYVQLLSEMGTGWNLGNTFEAVIDGTPYETAWGNPVVTQEFITKVKDAGFNTIRMPVSYFSRIGSAPDYTIEAEWLDRIREVVDYAFNENMFVIINIHGDGYNSIPGGWLLVNAGDQVTIKAKYQKVWEQVANTFVNYNERLIFESMNEVFDGDYSSSPGPVYYSNLNDYNQIFVDTVRQTGGNNSARWLLVPGWNTNIDYTAGDYGFVIPGDTYRSSSVPSDEKRIAISVHYYSPWDFCGDSTGQVTQWGPEATDPDKKSSWGQEDFMESQFNLMYNTFVTQGYPFIVGEYSATDKSNIDPTNNFYRAEFAKTLCAKVRKYGGVSVYWDNGHNGTDGGCAVFDRRALSVTQEGIVGAILEALSTTPAFDPDVEPVVIIPEPFPAGSFTVTFTQSSWSTGATVSVDIQNNLTTDHIFGWTLKFEFPGNQQIVNMWGGSYVQEGPTVTVTNADYNNKIAANGGTINFGFNLSYSGTNDEPVSFILNGTECLVE